MLQTISSRVALKEASLKERLSLAKSRAHQLSRQVSWLQQMWLRWIHWSSVHKLSKTTWANHTTMRLQIPLAIMARDWSKREDQMADRWTPRIRSSIQVRIKRGHQGAHLSKEVTVTMEREDLQAQMLAHKVNMTWTHLTRSKGKDLTADACWEVRGERLKIPSKKVYDPALQAGRHQTWLASSSKVSRWMTKITLRPAVTCS